ncbi:MAG: DVU0298 family protein [Thermodesulfobacteriota bacterium]
MAKKSCRRETKQKVGEILWMANEDAAMEMLKQIPDKQLVGHLFAHFYDKNELIKFRSAAAMGALAARIGQRNIEQARIILRRIMWNLNDESGGIGWGSPEAMGEILCQNPKLAQEFKSILFSYLEPGGNFIEHEMLQRGVVWGIGTYLKANPEDLRRETQELLTQHLLSQDAVKRVYSLRALINANYFDNHPIPENIMADNEEVNIFKNWDFFIISASDMAQAL